MFGAVFAFAYTSMQPIYPGEVMSNDMRAKGMGTYKVRLVDKMKKPLLTSLISLWVEPRDS